ncbi:MAG: domain S-box, partial [Chloroflexi bacterium]|nr:domain S-box [Chloroflexota bacterium]
MPKSAGFLTSGLAAQQLGISKRTLMRAALRGEIQPASRSPGGWARFSATDVADYAQRLSGKRAHSPSSVVQPRPTLTGTSPMLLGLTNEHQCNERRDVEAHYRFIAELTSDYAYRFELQADGQWVVTWVSGAFERMTGYALQDISLEQIQASLLYPEDAPIAARRAATLLAGWPDVWEYRIVTKSGEIRWLRDCARPLWNDDLGRVVSVGGMAQDITEAKKAAEQIRFQTGLLESVEQAVISTDLAGTITFWNRAAEELYGWTATEVLGQHVSLITAAASMGGQADAILQQVRDGGSWSGEFFVQRRDGITFPVHVTDSPIYDDSGEMIGIVGVSLDITERKQAERIAEQAQHAAVETARLRDEQAEEARAMAKVAVALASSIEPTRLYHLILEQAAQFLPCNNACMFLLQDDWAVLAAGWGEPNLPVGMPVYPISEQDRAFYWPEAGGPPRYFPDMLEVPGHIPREPWVGEHRVRS